MKFELNYGEKLFCDNCMGIIEPHIYESIEVFINSKGKAICKECKRIMK